MTGGVGQHQQKSADRLLRDFKEENYNKKTQLQIFSEFYVVISRKRRLFVRILFLDPVI